MPVPAAPRAGWLSAADLAQMFACTTQTLRDLAKAGVIPKAVKGNYPLAPSVKGYVVHLREMRKANAQAAAENELKRSKQREIDLRIAQKMGDLVDFSDVSAAFSQILGGFRAEMNGLPAAVSRDRAVRAAVQKGLDDAFTRCEGRFREASTALRTGRDPFEGDDEDDA